MRMKKETVCVLFAVSCLVLTSCGKGNSAANMVQKESPSPKTIVENTVQPKSPSTKSEVKKKVVVKNDHNKKSDIDLYVDVLLKYVTSGKKDFSVSFIDLNGDETKEMVVIFGESEADGGYLYTVKNGKAIQIKANNQEVFGKYGGFTYRKKENVFITESENTSDSQVSSTTTYYMLEDGKAVCKDVTESVTQFENNTATFYINSNVVGESEYDNVMEKYGLKEMSTVSYADGVRVTSNQMDSVYNEYNN